MIYVYSNSIYKGICVAQRRPVAQGSGSRRLNLHSITTAFVVLVRTSTYVPRGESDDENMLILPSTLGAIKKHRFTTLSYFRVFFSPSVLWWIGAGL